MPQGGFSRFFLRVTACHMVTYFVAGILAYTLLDYATAFQSEHFACWMRPTTSSGWRGVPGSSGYGASSSPSRSTRSVRVPGDGAG